MNMKRTNFHFPEQLLAQLRKLSKQTGIPVAEHIRRAIHEYLKGMKTPPLPPELMP